MDTPSTAKRSLSDDHGPPSKKIKNLSEIPTQYSDAVRRKLATTSRTGQACDRCKERKMKCDTNPMSCTPCRQKGLRCYTTDRVTGQSRERGESDRTENELQYLREQVASYQREYGSLQQDVFPPQTNNSSLETSKSPTPHTPSSQYVGWPAPENTESLHTGPVNGTQVDILDGIVDVAAFQCEMTEDYPIEIRNKFNLSRTSVLNTITGLQRIIDPKLPSQEEATREANHFLVIMSQYIPVVHRPSFMDLVRRFHERPLTVTTAERVQVIIVLAIMSHQTAVRNYLHAAEKFEDSHRWLHYGLGFYRDLLEDRSLASMQAMTLILVHFRNLPKPGYSWSYSHKLLIRAIELQYDRDPDKIELPPGENNPLSKELRKRVFHSILGVCVTTGCRVGRPAPWQFQHLDIPLPKPLKDTEITTEGIVCHCSGQSDFWPAIQLSKLLPLLTELYNNITSVRRSEADYLKSVDALNAKIIAWRQDWDVCLKTEQKPINLAVATLLVETWAAEYQLTLHHPVCCTSKSPEVIERNLDVCHRSAKRLLQAFHTLSSKYKAADFTWHSTVAYTMGFGITLHIYRTRKAQVSREQFEAMKNELKGWMSLMAYADLVMRTGNHLQRLFQYRVRILEEEYQSLLIESPGKPRNTHNGFLHVNTTNERQETISEPSPRTEDSTIPNAQNTVSPQQMRNETPLVSYRRSHSIPGTSQWPAPFQYSPEANGSSSSEYNNNNYAQQSVTHYPAISTTLAPLLNEPHNIYLSYPTPPQTQSTATAGDPTMNFTPSHYFDGPGPLMWPLITMPPGQGGNG